jgi:hypothetical protein
MQKRYSDEAFFDMYSAKEKHILFLKKGAGLSHEKLLTEGFKR